MSEHTVTEHILNAGFQRSATISCSCGLSIDIANIRKLSLRAGRKQLEGMHKNLTPENSPKSKTDRKILMDAGGSLPKPKKEKKAKKQKTAHERDITPGEFEPDESKGD